jgi:sulfoxide reductase heme-binding subunit YedZ
MVALRTHWRWLALNGFAWATALYILAFGSDSGDPTFRFDRELEFGKWALRYLVFCLAMSPASSYLGWRWAVKLRKSAGLWSFAFGCMHLWYYSVETRWSWLTDRMPFFVALGLLGLVILAALALTSNRWSMKRLGKRWKALHRLVYIAGAALVYHAVLATTASKKLLRLDPHAIEELNIYLGVMALLLFLRLPAVRRFIKALPGLWRQRGPQISG